MALPLTLLSLAARTGNDAVIGLIEDVVTYSPEFAQFPVRTVPGVTYKVGRRTSLPSSGFRNVNEGVGASASVYVQEIKQLYFMDGQLQVDEAIVKADDRSVGDVLADEGAGELESTILAIGAQTYYGTAAGAKGFAGLSTQINDDSVFAGGTSNTCSAYLVDLSYRGVHFVLGNNGGLILPPWIKQQVRDANSNPYMAYVTNLSAYLGLAVNSAYSVWRVRGIDTTHALTDALGAKAYEHVPVSRRQSSNLRWLMNTLAIRTLQVSRSAVGYQAAGAGGGGAFAPMPTELCNVPIILTDSLTNTEITTAS